MKKQLFIILLALFAVSYSYGQNPFDPPSCTNDPLHPAAGQQYAYTVSIPNTYTGYNGDGTFDWWVTQDVNLLTGTVEPNGTDFTATGTYNTPTAGQTTVNITWNGTAIGNGNYYLVVRYRETNTSSTATCAPDNVKVFMITPQNTFWLRIENVADAAGTTGGNDVCAADVSSAIITNTTSPGTVEYLYGVTTHYVKISANGYTGLWDAELDLSGLISDMEFTSVAWSAGATTGTFTGAPTGGVWTSATQLPSLNTWDATSGTWGVGQPIILTIVITHNHHEGLADLPITIKVDGSFTAGGTTYDDLGGGVCTPEAAFADATTQTLRARPDLNAVTPTFVPEPLTQP